jgi:glutamine synthetase
MKDGCGYFEDRRPASNMDPYKVTAIIGRTVMLISQTPKKSDK